MCMVLTFDELANLYDTATAVLPNSKKGTLVMTSKTGEKEYAATFAMEMGYLVNVKIEIR